MRDGENWSWKSFLELLHFFLDSEIERDALAWLDGGLQFIVHHTGEVNVAQRLGLRVCSLRQALEALSFTCLEETQWGYTIYHHNSFVLGNPGRIEEILALSGSLSVKKDMVMPSIAYNSELKPLEVRLSFPDPLSKSWEVTVAPSILPRPTFDATEDVTFQNVDFGNSADENSWDDVVDNLDEWSDHDMNSPLWWSQRSDFSSICTDDLSDMDTLSQINAYYG
ncbi:Hypothetical protein PHPALM_20520 [Phytophthora palmivora]|uniref:Uncharacterized protein n=1 Tax=Phytophthora palmivora TaxID=4796 RepID=A0A2P4XEP6_9STRA|nr:Hypothetical protein PHPALM_20520 [Phytophthora palmivora]